MSSCAQHSLTTLVEKSLFPPQLLNFLPFELCLFPLLPRPGTTQHFTATIDIMLFMSLGMPFFILEDEAHPYQALRKLEECWIGEESESFLGLSWDKCVACMECLSAPPSRTLNREASNDTPLGTLPEAWSWYTVL